MMRIWRNLPAQAVHPVMAVLAGLAVFAAAGCGPAIGAAADHAARHTTEHVAGHAVAERPAARPAARPVPLRPAVAAFSGPRCSLAYLRTSLRRADVTVDSAAMNTSGTFAQPSQQPLTGLPPFCDVSITQTDPAGNPIHIDAWLPRSWNGRFEGVGGSVYACGPWYFEMAPSIRAGYAVAATDCGVSPADLDTASWALKDGQLNWPLIRDFAYAGIHDMTVVGKAATMAYYSSPLRFSYFNGCSTGGREGLTEAQRYPADYNGIVSGAPAINWTRFIPAEIWPLLVMNRAGDFLPACKEAAFADAATKACGTGGVISDPSACDWNPDNLIGVLTPCGVITSKDANVMTKIWQGPRSAQGKNLWYGLERGASLAGLAATYTSDGVTAGQPFPVTVSWLGTWLQRNPSWDWRTLTYAQFDRLFKQSIREFSGIFASNNPDLSAFKKHGGKIIIWHGLSDQLIFPQGTVRYYQLLQRAISGPRQADSFARLFLAPGAAHCASGAGAAPAEPAQPLDSLVNWVENGKAPNTIPATMTNPLTNLVTQAPPLCLYPRRSCA